MASDNRIIEVACLQRDDSYSASARKLVEAADALPSSPVSFALRTIVCFQLFHETEELLAGDAQPGVPFAAALDRCAAMLGTVDFGAQPFVSIPETDSDGVLEETANHYGNLFAAFDADHYFGEAVRLLRDRFERNGFATDSLPGPGLRALDAGCGGGRYTVALRRFGFGEVVGVDASEIGVEVARRRAAEAGIEGVEYACGDVLQLPFEDASFDFVFSNGVLHHTTDLARGVGELLRVLRRGGRGFLYLIEDPGGIFWDVIEILRSVMAPVPSAFARSLFAVLGVAPNRRFYVLDHILTPINQRLSATQVEEHLSAAGATQIERLERGTDFDRIEQIHRGVAHAEAKFGVGENRYFFSR